MGSPHPSFLEQYGDSTQLLYLRARYYNPADGRFITKDPSRMESNLYVYTMSNPINRIDPSGLFSKELIQKNMDFFEFSANENDYKNHSHWGFYAALRDAWNGSWIKAGYVDIMFAPERVTWVSREQIYSDNCNFIMIGHRTLERYYKEVINRQLEPAIWWRDTSVTSYEVHFGSDTEKKLAPFSSYTDGSDRSTYPQFKGGTIDLGQFGISYITDLDGNPYFGISGFGKAPPPWGLYGIAYTEGYTCGYQLASPPCSPQMPSETEIEQAIFGVCYGGGLAIFTGVNLSAICLGKGLSFSGASMFYLGLEFGAGDAITAVAPIGDIVGRNPSKGWRWAVNKQKNGVTLGYVNKMNGWFLP